LNGVVHNLMLGAMTASAAPRRPPSARLLAALRQRFGDRVSTAAAVCAHHGRDASYHPPHPPDAVVFARSTVEVADAVRPRISTAPSRPA